MNAQNGAGETLPKRALLSKLLLAGFVVAVSAVTVIGAAAPPHALGNASPGVLVGARSIEPAGTLSSSAAPLANVTPSNLQLGVSAAPQAICANQDTACSAGAPVSRVTLSASAGGNGQLVWPAVQVAFVVETTNYDGVFDPTAGEPGFEPCALQGGTSTLCEESNDVPFFIANAQSIASAIQAANPHTSVSFAMVDYFATIDNWDDGDGAEYHVDIPQFIPASDFGSAVQQTFFVDPMDNHYYYGDNDMADNFLHSSVITALYGTIIGSGLDWANNTHHVIVWIGSTAPRDPGYAENYCISGSAWNSYGQDWGCTGSTCEPSYHFVNGASPGCEGWIHSQDGNMTHSIAALAHTATQCTQSIGGDCTIDAIDVWNTPTDPYSQGWPTKYDNIGGGPGGSQTVQDSEHILEAGCDIAAATGGTWSGPAWASCPNGQQGSLQYVPHGPYDKPYTSNPTLFNAIRQIGFGPVLETQVASGGVKPIFQFLPFGNIAIAPNLQATAACLRQGELLHSCQTLPTFVKVGGVTGLAWNWSTNKSTNTMFVGDSWTASFNVIAVGPPYALVPVDACVTATCKSGGSGSILGSYTWASYVPATNNTVVTESFPLASIRVELATSGGLIATAPPPPPVPPPFAIPTAPPLPVPQQIGVGQSVGIANFSLQAIAAGLLSAGFMRVSIKVRPIAMRVAAKTGRSRSMFEAEGVKGQPSVGHFE